MSEALIQVHELWFDDGSIILRAHRYIFKVYKGLLASRSPVLSTLFHEKEKKKRKKLGSDLDIDIDGCPIVKLDDNPEDLRVFLLALYHTGFFPESKPTDFDTLAGILRLSVKYSVTELLHRCINHLLSTYPMTLEDWDRRSKTRTLPSVSNAPFVVLELIRELEDAVQEKGWGRSPNQVVEQVEQAAIRAEDDHEDEDDATSAVSTTMDITMPSPTASTPTTTVQTPHQTPHQAQPFHNALVALGLQPPQSPLSDPYKPPHSYPNPLTPLSIILPAVLYCCCTHPITDFFDGVYWSGTSPLLTSSPYLAPSSHTRTTSLTSGLSGPGSRLAIARPPALSNTVSLGGSRLPPLPSAGFREESKETREHEREAARRAKEKAKAKARAKEKSSRRRVSTGVEDDVNVDASAQQVNKENLIDWDGEEDLNSVSVSGSIFGSVEDRAAGADEEVGEGSQWQLEAQPIPPDSLLLTPTPTHSDGGDNDTNTVAGTGAPVAAAPTVNPPVQMMNPASPTTPNLTGMGTVTTTTTTRTSKPKRRIFGPQKPESTDAGVNTPTNAQAVSSTFDNVDAGVDGSTSGNHTRHHTSSESKPPHHRKSSSSSNRHGHGHSSKPTTSALSLLHPSFSESSKPKPKPKPSTSTSTALTTRLSAPPQHTKPKPKPYPAPPRRIRLTHEDQRRCMVAVTELIDRKSEMIYGFLRREVVDGCLFEVVSDDDEELVEEEDVEGTPHHNVASSNWVVTRNGGSNSKKHKAKPKEKRKEKQKQKHKEELRKRTPCTYARLHAFATRTVLDVAVLQDDFDWSDFERRVCTVCYEKAKNEFMKERKRVWEELPGVFGLPSWSVLASAVSFGESGY